MGALESRFELRRCAQWKLRDAVGLGCGDIVDENPPKAMFDWRESSSGERGLLDERNTSEPNSTNQRL